MLNAIPANKEVQKIIKLVHCCTEGCLRSFPCCLRFLVVECVCMCVYLYRNPHVCLFNSLLGSSPFASLKGFPKLWPSRPTQSSAEPARGTPLIPRPPRPLCSLSWCLTPHSEGRSVCRPERTGTRPTTWPSSIQTPRWRPPPCWHLPKASCWPQ